MSRNLQKKVKKLTLFFYKPHGAFQKNLSKVTNQGEDRWTSQIKKNFQELCQNNQNENRIIKYHLWGWLQASRTLKFSKCSTLCFSIFLNMQIHDQPQFLFIFYFLFFTLNLHTWHFSFSPSFCFVFAFLFLSIKISLSCFLSYVFFSVT